MTEKNVISKMDENWVISKMTTIVGENREKHPNLPKIVYNLCFKSWETYMFK